MGAVRGLGFQKYGAIFTFVSFICIGMSSSLLLIFKAHLGVSGNLCPLQLYEAIGL